MMKKQFPIIITAFLMFFVTFPAFAASEKIDIAVSVPPQAYFAERIGKNHVSTHIMIPGGANPDTYEPTPRQLINLSHSRMYVKVGAPTFPFEKKFLLTFLDRNPHLTIIDSSAGLKLRTGDPHTWTSPASVRIAAANIAKALVIYDPSHKDEYERNLAEFLAEIDRLDQGIRKSLQGKGGYSFMVYHPAWGYFADEYNLVQIPIEEEGKPGNAARIRGIIDLARKKGMRDVLVQKGFDARNARTIARELGGRIFEVNPLGRNWPSELRTFTGALTHVLTK
ncbi:MAG: zinc ABC transporter substrate-binding protein [Syntrophales bacterium]|jgi:zinc transport system substrate-binding protein|nr:zinc ABC transporter substrate-binding protein [Syntrophales bacterium]